jgi:hypothetical protein
MKKGFSFIEIMIAVVVLMAGIFPVYYLLTSGTRGIHLGINEILAVNHASSVMELLRGLSFSQVHSFVNPGSTLMVTEKGTLVYNRVDEKMERSPSPDAGGLTVDGASSDGQTFVNQFFKSENFPPMEYIFDRVVEMNCESKFCVVRVKVEWTPPKSTGRELGEKRDVELKTVVVGMN